MERSAEVVIIGGGIVGTACSYFLSREGAKVSIVERDGLGAGASGHGAGGLAVPLHFSEPPEHAYFMRQAVNLLKWVAPRISEETGVDVMWREVPWLEIAKDKKTWEYMKEWTPRIPGKTLLDTREVLRLEPRLSPNGVLGGSIEEGDGQMDSYRMTLAFARASERRGAEVIIDEAVGLEKSGERVTGVKTKRGLIGCDRVVLAMGAWTGLAKEWLDFPMLVGPMKGDIVYLKYKGEEFWPFFVISYDEVNGEELPTLLHKCKDGKVITGVTVEVGRFNTATSEAARNDVLRRAMGLMPCIAESEVIGHVSGPRPSPADGNTVLGPVPGWEGVYAAVTLPGIICCALMGQVITDFVYDRPTTVPVESFSPERFTRPLTVSYGYNKLVNERPI